MSKLTAPNSNTPNEVQQQLAPQLGAPEQLNNLLFSSASTFLNNTNNTNTMAMATAAANQIDPQYLLLQMMIQQQQC